MKKIGCLVIVIIAAALIVLALLGLLKGFGSGGSGNSKGNAPASSSQSAAPSTAEEPLATPEKSELQDVIAITVAENEYLLNNQRVELQEIEAAVLECEQEVIVKITDDNASRKAYKGLVDLLDDLDVSYTEGDS